MRKFLLTCLSLWLIGIHFSQAQTTQLAASLEIGIPTNDFAENTESVGVGFNLGAYFAVAPGVPVLFGLEGGYMNYGFNRTEIRQNLSFLGTNIPLHYDIETNNSLVNGHVVFRVVAPIPNVQLYADALVGGRYIYTRSKVINKSPSNQFFNSQSGQTYNEQIQARTNIDDWIFSYGAGGGIMLGGGPVKVDVRVVYLLGTEAEYLDRETVQNAPPPTITNANEPIPNYDYPTKSSRTDMFFAHIGVVVAF